MTTMTCPDEGTLRAFLDRADDDHAALAAHVRGCLDCRRAVRELRLAAAVTSDALALLDEPAAQPVQAVADPYEIVEPPVRTRHWGRIASGAAAVALAVGLTLTPAGQAVAGGLLNLFHSQSVTEVTISNADARQVATVLQKLGVTTGTPSSSFAPVASLAEAQAKVAFPVATPRPADVPAGLTSTPTVGYLAKSDLTVTFDAAKTAAYLQNAGSSTRVPAGLDGEKLVLHFPDAVALEYKGANDKLLMVVSAGAFEASTVGPLDVTQLRDFLLHVPGIPTSLTDQLGHVDLAAGALPLPIPVDQVRGTKTTVNGHSAVLVSSGGIGSAVAWQSGDRLTGVAGTYGSDVVLKVASGLKG
ncbi:MAG TPA: hypothetical protein VFK68_00885 [Propionibacteriaceae bacterium]|nr:hypothetical protein [Propionibacteriaceae bacterium]